MDQLEDLNWLRERARLGINQARRVRKYCPPGPFTRIEQATLSALVEIERRAGALLATQKGDHNG